MKKIFLIPACYLLLTGCGDGLPSECNPIFNKMDEEIATLVNNQELPEQARKMGKEVFIKAREELKQRLKSMDKDQAAAFCKLTVNTISR